jgi:hypothetical protein
MLIAVVLAALEVGYLARPLSFKVKDRCPRCGATTNELARQRVGHTR